MAVKVLELFANQRTTREIELLGDPLEIQFPPTPAGWRKVEAALAADDVIITSADGDHFLGRVQDVDEERYTVTVELS